MVYALVVAITYGIAWPKNSLENNIVSSISNPTFNMPELAKESDFISIIIINCFKYMLLTGLLKYQQLLKRHKIIFNKLK